MNTLHRGSFVIDAQNHYLLGTCKLKPQWDTYPWELLKLDWQIPNVGVDMEQLKLIHCAWECKVSYKAEHRHSDLAISLLFKRSESSLPPPQKKTHRRMLIPAFFFNIAKQALATGKLFFSRKTDRQIKTYILTWCNELMTHKNVSECQKHYTERSWWKDSTHYMNPFTWTSDTHKTVRNEIPGFQGWDGDKDWLGHERTFWGDGNSLYLNGNMGFIDVHICQSLSNSTCNICMFYHM